MRFLFVSISSFALASALSAAAPSEVTFTGSPNSPIAAGVAVPANTALFCLSGTVPSLVDREGKTARDRYGDTYTQGLSCLKNIESRLAEQGLSLRDVVYLRVYVVADPAADGKPDFAGWFKAYAERFNNEANPTKAARSTVGVAALVNPDWLIEIEAFAAYPAAP